MAEKEYSMLWATGTSADGSDGYTAEETRQLWRSMFSNGILKGYLNNLTVNGATVPGVTKTTGPIVVATGAAIIQGYPYFNIEDSVTKTLATPSTGTTGFRVVIRVDWVGTAQNSTPAGSLHAATTQYTARVLLITSPDGTADIPAETTIDGTVYDLTLATGTIGTDGIVDLTPALTYSAPRGEVAASNIANRTRSFIIPASSLYGYDWGGTSYGYLHYNNINGRLVTNEGIFCARGVFEVPQDYASNMTVSAVILNKETMAPLVGNIRCSMDVEYGAIGESGWNHTANVAEATVAIANTETLYEVSTANLSSASAGDIVTLQWERDGSDALDTYQGLGIYFVGFRVTYTADS